MKGLGKNVRMRNWVRKKYVDSIVEMRIEEMIERSKRFAFWAMTHINREERYHMLGPDLYLMN